jgi:hypothetical protein
MGEGFREDGRVAAERACYRDGHRRFSPLAQERAEDGAPESLVGDGLSDIVGVEEGLFAAEGGVVAGFGG